MNTDGQLEQLFRVCDKRGKGYIVRDELRELCRGLGITTEDSNAIFNDLDHDNDGKITFEDFSFGFQEFLIPEEVQTKPHNSLHRRRASMWSVSTELSHQKLYKSNRSLDGYDDHELRRSNSVEWDLDEDEEEVERRKKETIYQAWTTFTSSLVDRNLLSLSNESQNQISQLYKELECRKVPAIVATQVDSTVTSLMKEMEKLHMQNKALEEMYNKEKSTHVQSLQSLENEMEDQVARVEEMAKEKANLEKEEEKRQLQEQMDEEVAEMQAHLKIFKKVDSWLNKEQWTDEERMSQFRKKLDESNTTNRDLRKNLQETSGDLAILRSEMAHCRVQYEDKCRELHQEREQVLEYMHQYDHLRRQLDLIHSANQRLQDTNDGLRQTLETDLRSPTISRTSSFRSSLRKNLKGSRSLSPVPLTELCENPISPIQRPFGITRLLEDLDSGLSTLPDKSDGSGLPDDDPFFYCNGPPSIPVLDSPTYRRRTSQSSRGRNSMVSVFEVPDRTYKVVLAGDAAVGKSTFISRLCNGIFVPNMASTLGVDYKVKTLRVDDKNMVVQLWDTAGQERFRSITKCYFRRADGVLLLYDVINEKSFMNVREWIQNINESCLLRIPFVICGNKIDLRSTFMKRGVTIVTPSAGERIAKESGADFFETSTKTGENVMEAMTELAKQMMASEDLAIKSSTFKLIPADKKSTRCCSSKT